MVIKEELTGKLTFKQRLEIAEGLNSADNTAEETSWQSNILKAGGLCLPHARHKPVSVAGAEHRRKSGTRRQQRHERRKWQIPQGPVGQCKDLGLSS